ncbi:MAG: hypothetical protein GX053_09295, partial [Tissierella sp.]|nr:hypothetical protein [Tissierella sp.]
MFNTNNILSFILCLFDSLLFVFLLNHFKIDDRRKWLTDLFLTIGITILVFTLTISGVAPHLKILVLTIVLFICTYLYDFKWEYRLILVVFYHFIIISIELIVVSFVVNTLDISIDDFSINYTSSIFLLGLISKFLTFISMILFSKILKPANVMLSLAINALFVGILLISIVSMILLFYLSIVIGSQNINNIFFLICSLIILIDIAVICLYLSLNEYNLKIQKEEVQRVYNKLYE